VDEENAAMAETKLLPPGMGMSWPVTGRMCCRGRGGGRGSPSSGSVASLQAAAAPRDGDVGDRGCACGGCVFQARVETGGKEGLARPTARQGRWGKTTFVLRRVLWCLPVPTEALS